MVPEDFSSFPNMYRRNFDWRISHGKSITQSDAAGMAYLSTSDYPEILEDILCVTRKRCGNRTAIAKVQLQMLSELANQEQAVKHYKSKLDVAGENKPMVEAEIFRYRMIANSIRIIGDGIAWRILKHERVIPRVLCGHPVKHVIAEDGLQAEVGEFLKINRTLSIPIFNAITNCLAMGDITVVDPDGDVEIVEVKTSNVKGGRKTKQKIKLRETVQFLGEAQGVVNGKEVAIRKLPITPKSNIAMLSALLEECETAGWSSGLIGSHCFVECVDLGHPEDIADKLPLMTTRQEQLLSGWEMDRLVEMDSMSVITFSPNLAPFSIYPIRDKICIELMIGAKYFRSILNVTKVAKMFEDNGWTVICYLEEAIKRSNNEAVMLLTKGGFECQLPPGDFAKIQFEMLDPATLIEECEYIRTRAPRDSQGYAVWAYAGESSQWR